MIVLQSTSMKNVVRFWSCIQHVIFTCIVVVQKYPLLAVCFILFLAYILLEEKAQRLKCLKCQNISLALHLVTIGLLGLAGNPENKAITQIE